MFLKIWQLLKENTCVRVSVFQNSPTQVISCVICEIVKNIFFNRTPWVAASVFDRILLHWWWHVQECLQNRKGNVYLENCKCLLHTYFYENKKDCNFWLQYRGKNYLIQPGSRTPARTGWLLFLAIYGQSKEAVTGGVLESS